MRHFPILALMLSLAWLPFVANAASIQELERKIKKLEEEVEAAREDVSEMIAQSDSRFKISGYTSVEYFKEPSLPGGFRMHHLNLYFQRQLLKKWKFFSEVEFEDAADIYVDNGVVQPESNGRILIEAVNFEYQVRGDFSFRLGRIFTPAGIWAINHADPFVPTQIRPLHIFDIFPRYIDGFLWFGTRPVSKSFLKYNAYFANGEGNNGSGDKNDQKAIGAKLSTTLAFLKFTEVGASIYIDKDEQQNDKDAFGVHMRSDLGAMHFQAEYAYAKRSPAIGPDYNSLGYYGQLYFDVGKFSIGGRYDFFDPNDSLDVDKTQMSFFINYRIGYNIVLKYEHHLMDYADDPEKNELMMASVVVHLGN